MKNIVQSMVQRANANLREAERGNVLFLILIAVALFAALSYAVTSSSRSGGGDASGETNLVNSAQVTQYPASVRTALIRMFVSNGIAQDELNFDSPSTFSSGSCNSAATKCVFHPTGGGATYTFAPAEVMESGSQGQWIFSSKYKITDIGTNATDGTGNDIIAFLPGIKSTICKKLNSELGIVKGPSSTDGDTDGLLLGIAEPTLADSMDSVHGSATIPTSVTATLAGDFIGQPFGCFDRDETSSTAGGVYYHVLVER
jgi:hypothetical protein